MRGKKAKQLRVDRTAEREAVRRKQRQQTMFTVIVVAIIVGIGGVLIYLSIDRPTEDLADDPTEEPTDAPDDRPVACGAQTPEGADAERDRYEQPEQVLEEGVDYAAVITTSCGPVRVDLYEERSPETVNNFVFLAQEGFFDGLQIFRNATTIGALQTGAGNNAASWEIGYTLTDELEVAEEDGYPVGTLAMANGGPDTAGSQFFFVYNDLFDEAFAENRTYAVFGRANAKGREVLAEIGDLPIDAPDSPSGSERPSEITYIESVEIIER